VGTCFSTSVTGSAPILRVGDFLSDGKWKALVMESAPQHDELSGEQNNKQRFVFWV